MVLSRVWRPFLVAVVHAGNARRMWGAGRGSQKRFILISVGNGVSACLCACMFTPPLHLLLFLKKPPPSSFPLAGSCCFVLFGVIDVVPNNTTTTGWFIAALVSSISCNTNNFGAVVHLFIPSTLPFSCPVWFASAPPPSCVCVCVCVCVCLFCFVFDAKLHCIPQLHACL